MKKSPRKSELRHKIDSMNRVGKRVMRSMGARSNSLRIFATGNCTPNFTIQIMGLRGQFPVNVGENTREMCRLTREAVRQFVLENPQLIMEGL